MHTAFVLDNLPTRPTYQADVFHDISARAERTKLNSVALVRTRTIPKSRFEPGNIQNTKY